MIGMCSTVYYFKLLILFLTMLFKGISYSLTCYQCFDCNKTEIITCAPSQGFCFVIFNNLNNNLD